MRRLLVVCLGFVLLVGEVRGAVAPGDAAARLGQALGAKDPLAVDEALKDIAQEKAGPAPLKVIEEASKSGDADVRGLAAYALTQIDPEKAKAGLPALIEMLKSANPRNRVRATIGMQTLGPAAAAAAPALVGALKDEDFRVRGGAVTALGWIGPVARLAIPALIKALGDDQVPVRGMTVIALGKFGADARDALPALLEMLKSEPVADVRKQVFGALEQIGGTPVDALCIALKDREPEIRQWAAADLLKIGPDASCPVARLGDALRNDDDPLVRKYVALTLGKFGSRAGPAVGALTWALLNDKVADVRRAVAATMVLIAPVLDTAAVEALVKALDDDDDVVRQDAARALGQVGPATKVAEVAGPPLRRKLKDQDVNVRLRAANALSMIAPAAKFASGELMECLKDEDPRVRMAAAVALSNTGPQPGAPVESLVEMLRKFDDPQNRKAVRSWALLSLGSIGNGARLAVPALIEALKDDDANLRILAASALSQIGPEAAAAVSALSELQQDRDAKVQFSAAVALCMIGKCSAASVPVLIKDGLKNEEPHTRSRAAIALSMKGPEVVPKLTEVGRDDKDPRAREAAVMSLGLMGYNARGAIPDLREALGDEDVRVKLAAARALGGVASGLQLQRKTSAIPKLEEVVKALKDAESNPEIKANDKNNEWGASLDLVEKALKALRAEVWSQLYDQITRNPWVLTALGFLLYFGILLLFWGLLLRRRPLLILKINDALSGYQGYKLPWGDLKITPRDAILARSFQYHPRVLDAWVAGHVAVYRENFRKLATVRDRSVHISVPVVLGDEVVPELKADRLKATFSREKACLLIWGEGGSGKTSLACQMAGWAMAQDEPDRLCQHPMLPVLIEEDFQPSAPTPTAGPIAPALMETIRGQVQLLTGKAEPPSAELSDRLLRRRRVLVIVDHLSEMGEATRSAVRPGQPDFPVNALIVTSRIRETLGNAISTATVVQPLRVEGNRLSSFIDAYLLQRGKRQLFDDREFFKACEQLTLIVGGSKSTVLLAKLFAEQLIGQREGAQAGALPANVPDLMLGYVNELNRNIPDNDRRDDREVRRDAEVLAWECLKLTYQPAPVTREHALKAIGGDEPPARLAYLEKRLGLIRTTRGIQELVAFTLDPLAEYLAALHVVDRYRGKANSWRTLLEKGPVRPETGNAFLSAVWDCCQVAGLDPGELQLVREYFSSVAQEAELPGRS